MCQTILQRIAAGESAAVDECLAKYGGLVWSVARRHCANHADAEDAVQEAFLGIWQSAERFDPEKGTEATFITMIVRRRLIDRHRKQGRRLDTASLEAQPVSEESHTKQVEISEEAAVVRRRMAELRPDERRVLELAISEGMSQSQIADATSLPLGTVKTHARRGLIRLREMLEADSPNHVTEAQA